MKLSLNTHTIQDEYLRPYDVLANAIIIRAIRDYIQAKKFCLTYNEEEEMKYRETLSDLQKQRRKTYCKKMFKTPKEVMRFLKSPWCGELCATDQEDLVKYIESLDVLSIELTSETEECEE